MYEILYATDGSEDARLAGRLLAGLPLGKETRVTVVTAVPPAAALWVGRIPPDEWLSPTAQAEGDRAARQVGEEAAEALRARGHEVRVWVRVGPPAYAILKAAQEIPADLIVTGSKGLTGIPAFLIGSVSQNVAKHADCSVLVTRGASSTIEKVLVAVDGSEASETAVDRMLAAPLPIAAHHTVVYVLEPLDLRWEEYVTDPDAGSLRARVEHGRLAAAEHLVERVAGKLKATGREAEPLVLHGHPAEQLLEAVKERHPDLLVVGARGLNAIQSFLLGSVSGRMLRYAPCSVLVAR